MKFKKKLMPIISFCFWQNKNKCSRTERKREKGECNKKKVVERNQFVLESEYT